MNTDVIRNIQRINKKIVYISLSLFLILFLLFVLIKVEVFKSMDFSIQKSLQSDYPYINNKIPRDIYIIHRLNKIFVPYSLIIIINNFSNIYKTFNLFQILSVACYISCILKFIFFKIIMNDENSIIYYCGEGWNLPSTEMIISVVFYLTLWNLFFDYKDKNYVTKTNKFFKFLLLCIIIAFNITNLIVLTKIGYYLFSHLIFSAILGILIYIFIFETNIIKKYNSKEFCSFIKKKFELYIIINVLLVILTFIPYNIERHIKNNNRPECIPIEGSFFYKSKSPFITYVDDTYSLISIFFAHIFVVVGIKCELAFFFGNNIQNFEQYHFGVNIDDLNLEKELKNNTGTIIVTRETEWNNTSIIKSLIRLILTFILAGICFLPYYSIKTNGVDFSTIFLVKYLLSYALFSFGITFLYKIIFRIFRLSNEILGSILNDQ
jgi:hypothetical protein